ncbi:aspartate aminotransferase [Rhizoctonia solani AG-1 IB]|uniref:Aspartate aminotransferase n=1 Tax=Thanatephorus cucumeris (strain AG1-IB / isolate 7/3/14) TaxID=1108050 RepID=M5C0A6_THACB|nr:aspartate aminotransferase [Rhizoctonia solani AG-1 IB]
MAPVSNLTSIVTSTDGLACSAEPKSLNTPLSSATLPHGVISLTQLAYTVPSSLVSNRAKRDDELWPRKLWDSKVSQVIARQGLSKHDCAELRYGNPQDDPIPGIVDVFINATFPPPGREVDWYAYSVPDSADLEAVAGRLSESRGVEYHPEDIIVTDGSLTALDLLIFASTDPGDEIIILSPVYFNYPVIIRHREAVPVIVPARPDSFEPDIEEIRRAVTPRTKAIIINSPNNPTGVIYSRECLMELAEMLEGLNATRECPILVISDEAYSRILYDDSS